MNIIVGLGNPEKKYKLTRHNAGFLAVDALAKEFGENWEKEKKFNAEIIKAGNIMLVKPLTYMNFSGDAIRKILNFYKIQYSPLDKGGERGLANILTVIHDDLDISLGKLKISVDSRSAGHNGVQSIIDFLGTKNFKRIRIGIKTDELLKIPADKFVLQKFKKEELEATNNLLPIIIKEIKKGL
jgi:PTH1 family peptidyl-tRNA hydrolase